MKYNQQLHHRRSIRLKGFDYSQVGRYYITINIHNRQCLFGEIVRVTIAGSKAGTIQKMKLNEAGIIANECWLAIPEHFPHAVLHEYVIMPNHVHGIIELADIVRADSAGRTNVGAKNFSPLHPDPPNHHPPNHHPPNHHPPNQHPPNHRPPNQHPSNHNPDHPSHQHPRSPSKTIGSIVRGFKIGVTKWFRNNMADDSQNLEKIWQRNYYEHIIRDERSYHNITHYIINNPANWKGC